MSNAFLNDGNGVSGDGDSGDGGASITVKGVSQQVQSHTSHPPVTTVGLMAAVSCNIVTQSVCSHAGACWGTCGDGRKNIELEE